MSRDFQINGETLVKVRFGGHVSPATSQELGLASDYIRIIPRFSHYDVNVDDFGPDIPAETLCNLAEINVQMSLVHYDRAVLAQCIQEAVAGGGFAVSNEGNMPPAGQPMGAGLPLLASGNHYIGLNLTSTALNYPWRFHAAYLADRPIEMPLGAKRSIVICNWRAIPYAPLTAAGDVVSSGVTLWDHTLDA